MAPKKSSSGSRRLEDDLSSMRQRWSGRGQSSGSGSTRGQSSSPTGRSVGQSSGSGSRGQSSGTGRSRLSDSQMRNIIHQAGVPEGYQASSPRIRAIIEETRLAPHAPTQDALDDSTFLEHYSGLTPLHHDWDDHLDSDSDETEPPSDEAPPPPQRRTRASTSTSSAPDPGTY